MRNSCTTPVPLAQAAAEAGAIVASGYAMLLHQAAAQVELMTGKPVSLEAMRKAGEEELARRALRWRLKIGLDNWPSRSDPIRWNHAA
jgi:hypothetical protein